MTRPTGDWGDLSGSVPKGADADARLRCYAKTRNGIVVATLMYVPDSRHPGRPAKVVLQTGSILSLPVADVLVCPDHLQGTYAP